jgi:C1A family cysteine protease
MDRILNVLPDKPDAKDFLASAVLVPSATIPVSTSMRQWMSPIVDQGNLGSCTANAIASGIAEFLQIRRGLPLTFLSRLFLYFHERQLEGTVSQDSGAYVRDGFKVLQTIGCAPEVDWPYDVTKYAVAPPTKAEQDALPFKIVNYHRVIGFDELKATLAAGNPVAIGFQVYSSFMDFDTAMTGMIPIPDTTKETLLGGHCMLAIGYQPVSSIDHIEARNSWGKGWGDQGYCRIPRGFFDAGLVFDMWTADMTVNPVDITFAQAIQKFVDLGIFVSPDFWVNFEAKYNAGTLTNDDFKWVFYGDRAIASYLINKGL